MESWSKQPLAAPEEERMVTEHGSVLAAPPLLEALPDAVVVADAGGRILYANAALTVLLGMTRPSWWGTRSPS